MDSSNHRMELIEQMRNMDAVNQNRLNASVRGISGTGNSGYRMTKGYIAEEEPLFTFASLKIRTMLAVLLLIGGLYLKTSGYGEELAKAVSVIPQNPTIEEAVDCISKQVLSR